MSDFLTNLRSVTVCRLCTRIATVCGDLVRIETVLLSAHTENVDRASVTCYGHIQFSDAVEIKVYEENDGTNSTAG